MKEFKNLDFFLDKITDSTLLAIAHELLEADYNLIFVMPEFVNDVDYFSYEKDGRIGYIQVANNGILSCSSQHKPSKDHGSGHAFKEGFSLSIEDVMAAKDFGLVKGVETWEGLEEFVAYREKFFKTYVFSNKD